MADLPPEEVLQDVLRELLEIKKDISMLSRQIAELSNKSQAVQQQPAAPDVEVAVSRIQEAADRIGSILQKALEELAYQREILLEELRKRDSLCESLLERIAALQLELEKQRGADLRYSASK